MSLFVYLVFLFRKSFSLLTTTVLFKQKSVGVLPFLVFPLTFIFHFFNMILNEEYVDRLSIPQRGANASVNYHISTTSFFFVGIISMHDR